MFLSFKKCFSVFMLCVCLPMHLHALSWQVPHFLRAAHSWVASTMSVSSVVKPVSQAISRTLMYVKAHPKKSALMLSAGVALVTFGLAAWKKLNRRAHQNLPQANLVLDVSQGQTIAPARPVDDMTESGLTRTLIEAAQTQLTAISGQPQVPLVIQEQKVGIEDSGLFGNTQPAVVDASANLLEPASLVSIRPQVEIIVSQPAPSVPQPMVELVAPAPQLVVGQIVPRDPVIQLLSQAAGTEQQKTATVLAENGRLLELAARKNMARDVAEQRERCRYYKFDQYPNIVSDPLHALGCWFVADTELHAIVNDSQSIGFGDRERKLIEEIGDHVETLRNTGNLRISDIIRKAKWQNFPEMAPWIAVVDPGSDDVPRTIDELQAKVIQVQTLCKSRQTCASSSSSH